jgi:hypothetical protein
VPLKHRAVSKLQGVRTQITVIFASSLFVYFNVGFVRECFYILTVQGGEQKRCSEDRQPELYIIVWSDDGNHPTLIPWLGAAKCMNLKVMTNSVLFW